MKRSETNINVYLALRGIDTDYRLAEMMGITPGSLSRRLAGDISMDTLEQISNALNVPIYELLKKETV
jgi:transcriptional regulator with XRE-family HTH domain